jgi:hypothetical protein
LHVLSTPPAFNLSQDQTLHLKSCDFYVRRESQSVFSINWLIGTRRQFAFANDRRESPHKLPVSIFKERPQNQLGEPRIMRHSACLSTPPRGKFRLAVFQLWPPEVAGSVRKGAQYSEAKARVNTCKNTAARAPCLTSSTRGAGFKRLKVWRHGRQTFKRLNPAPLRSA